MSWLDKTENERASTTQEKKAGWIYKVLPPYLGPLAISAIKLRDVLITAQRIKAHGAIESAHRVLQIRGQIHRFPVASGFGERDVSADLKGAFSHTTKKQSMQRSPIQKRVVKLLRAIYSPKGHPYAAAALKLSALLFVRPGELRAAERKEIDFERGEWRIPVSQMKMKM